MILYKLGEGKSTRFEDEDSVAKLRQVEKGKHMELIVEGGCHILSQNALPFALASSEVGFVLYHVFNKSHADILLHEAFGLAFLLFD